MRQQLGRKARRDPWDRQFAEGSAGDPHAFRRARHQRRESIDVLFEGLPQWRDRSLLARKYAFLLGQIEIGARSSIEALFDRIVDTLGAGDIPSGNPDSVLRHQNLEIGICNTRQGRERYDIAIEPVGVRRLFSRQCSIMVLSPKIDLVACA